MPTAAASNSKRSSGPVLRSLSPRGRFPSSAHTNPSVSSSVPYSSSFCSASSTSSAFASSTSFSFSSPQTAFFYVGPQLSASPTRVNLYTTSSPSSPNFLFSLDRSTSPRRSIVFSKQTNTHPVSFHKRICMCSPTTHAGSFRCSLHKKHGNGFAFGSGHSGSYTPNRLNMMRSAMKNSLVRIGGVEGEWVNRALTSLIRPSSHQLRRRTDFQPRPSRLSVMSRASDP